MIDLLEALSQIVFEHHQDPCGHCLDRQPLKKGRYLIHAFHARGGAIDNRLPSENVKRICLSKILLTLQHCSEGLHVTPTSNLDGTAFESLWRRTFPKRLEMLGKLFRVCGFMWPEQTWPGPTALIQRSMCGEFRRGASISRSFLNAVSPSQESKSNRPDNGNVVWLGQMRKFSTRSVNSR